MAHSNPAPSTLDKDYLKSNILNREVAIIGGGSSGTYAAIRLRQLGHSVIVIEKEGTLGGQTNTYTVPGSGLKIDYGLVGWYNTSIVHDYFAHFKIPIMTTTFDRMDKNYNVDFRTGKEVAGYLAPNSTAVAAALKTWVVQLEKYPFLDTGIDLPDPVPEDLLMSLKEFVAKYELDALVPTISSIGQGYADLLDQPTFYSMKFLGLDLARTLVTGFIVTKKRNNHEIYEVAAEELLSTDSLLLSSNTISVSRHHSNNGPSKVVVRTPSGLKLIKAQKIILAIPPRLSNFNGWDLDAKENAIFGCFRNEAYYSGILAKTGLPESYTILIKNVGADTPFNLAKLPGAYSFSSTAQAGLFNVKYGSAEEQNEETVKKNIIKALGTLRIEGVNTTPENAEWVAFKAHVPFFEHVSAEEIKDGFYRRANGLQGYKGTWYTGAAWETQDSSTIWRFTERLVEAMMKE